MEENTIDTMEAEDLSFDAEDWAEDTTAPDGSAGEGDGAAAAEEVPAAEEAPAEEAPAGDALTIKYNGAEMTLSREQAVTLAQKGMNYDKIIAERDRLREAPEIALVRRMAEVNGMTPEQYMQALEQAETRQKVQAYVQQGASEEMARRMVQLEAEQKQHAQAEAARQSNDARKSQIRAQVEEFHRAYPDVTEFPPAVMARIREGEHPVAAYRAYQIEQMSAEIKALKEQQAAKAVTEKNRAKAVGSVSGGGAAADPMMDAFDSVFS